MSGSIRAIPTEYRGIRFRSKTEAIFARAIDIMGFTLWEYEPDFAMLDDGYVPDFSVYGTFTNALIELKPKECTRTYKALLYDRAITLMRRTEAHVFYLVEVDPFDSSVGNIYIPAINDQVQAGGDKSLLWIPQGDLVMRASVQEAKSFRFDLSA